MSGLHVVDTGNPDGPPIVWLGSIGSSTAMWERQIPAFSAGYRCLLVDHPGHGLSPPPRGPLTIESMAAGVLDELDVLGVDRAHVVGLSLGAMVAMGIAADHPHRVDRLAVLCTSAYFGPDYGWTARAATVRADGMSAVAEATVGRWLTRDYAAAHPDDAAALAGMILATNPEGYASCCEAIAAMDLRDGLKAVTAATLVVAGTRDPATPPPHAETITSLVPGAVMHEVDAAHLANWERPGPVNELVRAHLGGGHDA